MENNNTKNGKKRKKEGKKKFGRIRTQHLRLDATTPNHYTTETDYVMNEKVFNSIPFHETSAGKMIASRINRAINSKKTM